MGKRKSSKKPMAKKRKDPLPTSFTCLFCNHDSAVNVKLDKKLGIGNLECKVCGQRFQCAVNYLSAPIDVYSEWVDAADAVAGHTHDDLDDINAIPDPPVASSSRNRGDDDDRAEYSGQGIVADDEEYE